MLDFVLLAAAEEGPRPFPEPVVEALRRVVPCDTVAYRAWSEGDTFDRSYAPGDLSDRWRVWLQYPDLRHDDPHPSEPPARFGGLSPVSAPGKVGRPLVLSDGVSHRRFWQTGLYFELMRPFAIRDVMKLFLPRRDGAGSDSVFVFDTSSRGFTENDTTLLGRLVPALVQLERNARLRSAVDSADKRLTLLTPRELTVLARAADGETTAQIAGSLFIGPSTVRKHLEHIYDKLDVPNRAAATAIYTPPQALGLAQMTSADHRAP